MAAKILVAERLVALILPAHKAVAAKMLVAERFVAEIAPAHKAVEAKILVAERSLVSTAEPPTVIAAVPSPMVRILVAEL